MSEIIITKESEPSPGLGAFNFADVWASLAHQLATPTTNIYIQQQLITHHTGVGGDKLRRENAIAKLMTASGNVVRIIGMVNEYSELFKREFSLEDTSTQSMFDWVWKAVEEEELGRIDLIVDESIPEQIKTNEQYLRKAVSHLVDNALIYSLPEDGQIIVNAWGEMVEGSQYIHMSVTDCGNGIAKEYIDEVCDPFFRGDEIATLGAGLGLSIVKYTVVDRLGGFMTINSEEGEGTQVTLSLPV